MKSELEELFGPVISTYSRQQAIADGVLVDVTEATDARGQKLSPFKFPVALTRAAYEATIEAGGHWARIENPTAEDLQAGCLEELVLPAGQDVAGRLWDVFWMLLCAMRSKSGSTDRVNFALHVNGPPRRLVQLKSLCGPGDNAEPVITILLPDED